MSTILALVYESLVGLSLAFGIRPVRFAFAVLRCAAIFGLVALAFDFWPWAFELSPIAYGLLCSLCQFAIFSWRLDVCLWRLVLAFTVVSVLFVGVS